MGKVIDIKTKRVPEPAPVAQQKGSQLTCKRCDAADFKIQSDGVVHCSDCGARMNNLTATWKGDAHAA